MRVQICREYGERAAVMRETAVMQGRPQKKKKSLAMQNTRFSQQIADLLI